MMLHKVLANAKRAFCGRLKLPQFWTYFHDLTRYLEEHEPTEAGVLDMNRYENL